MKNPQLQQMPMNIYGMDVVFLSAEIDLVTVHDSADGTTLSWNGKVLGRFLIAPEGIGLVFEPTWLLGCWYSVDPPKLYFDQPAYGVVICIIPGTQFEIRPNSLDRSVQLIITRNHAQQSEEV